MGKEPLKLSEDAALVGTAQGLELQILDLF